MRFFGNRRRPVIAIIGGVFLIGLGLVRVLSLPVTQIDELPAGLSEAIIPTPKLEALLATPSAEGTNLPEPNQLITKANEPGSIPVTSNQVSRVRESREKFGDEPKMAPLLEQINAAGKEFPVWMIIPSIKLSAPVVPATLRKVIMDGKIVDMWFAPDLEAAGWHTSSALPGEVGNLVFSGHNNEFGQVFSQLIDLKQGDIIQLITQKQIHTYRVSNKVLFQEVEINLSLRMENARWISPSSDERITLVTCWPRDSNTHRLVIVAAP